MKTTRIALLVLAFFAVQQIVEAQTLITSTTATTTVVHSKSGREKGFVFRPEIGLGAEINDFSHFVINVNGIASYQFNPYFAVGLGLGFDHHIHPFCFNFADIYNIDDDLISHDEGAVGEKYVRQGISRFPIFLNMRTYFVDRLWSPFLDFKVGYVLPMYKYSYEHSNTTEYGFGYIGGTTTTKMESSIVFSGLWLSGAMGVQFKRIDFGFGYGLANLKHKDEGTITNTSSSHNGSTIRDNTYIIGNTGATWLGSVLFTIGYNL